MGGVKRLKEKNFISTGGSSIKILLMLLIDNSNTRTKFALAVDGRLLPWHGVIDTAGVSVESVNELLKDISYERAVLCSVVPEKGEILKEAVGVPTHSVSSESNLSIDISYPTPKQIGADRLANAEAAFHKYGAPSVVIDSGTAVTFDVLKSPGSYAGGVIAPGLGLMTEYFLEKTALLPKLKPEEPKSFIGQSTLEAMNIGAIAGFRGLIREILTGLEEELECCPRIIATGGDAELLFRGVKRIEVVDQSLTLEGILRIGLLNQENFSDR